MAAAHRSRVMGKACDLLMPLLGTQHSPRIHTNNPPRPATCTSAARPPGPDQSPHPQRAVPQSGQPQAGILARPPGHQTSPRRAPVLSRGGVPACKAKAGERRDCGWPGPAQPSAKCRSCECSSATSTAQQDKVLLTIPDWEQQSQGCPRSPEVACSSGASSGLLTSSSLHAVPGINQPRCTGPAPQQCQGKFRALAAFRRSSTAAGGQRSQAGPLTAEKGGIRLSRQVRWTSRRGDSRKQHLPCPRQPGLPPPGLSLNSAPLRAPPVESLQGRKEKHHVTFDTMAHTHTHTHSRTYTRTATTPGPCPLQQVSFSGSRQALPSSPLLPPSTPQTQ